MTEILRKLEVLWGMPIFYQEDEEQELKCFGSFLTEGNPYMQSEELIRKLAKRSVSQDVPVIYKDGNKVYFICVRGKACTYFTGPICVEEMSYVELHHYYKEYGIPSSLETVPYRMDMEAILNFAGLLSELLTGETVDSERLLTQNSLVEEEPEFEQKEGTLIDLRIIKDEAYHHTYQEELYVMNCVKEGNVQDVLNRLDVLSGMAGILSSKKINHQRNLALVSVAIITRAAISGGLSPARAYRLSDLYINKIDKCTQIEEIVNYTRKAAYEFTKLVAETRAKKCASNYTEQCRDYIFKNYHHKIHLEEVAQAIGISQGHLSRVFQKDMGMSIQEYIQRFRIERAGNLLKYSEASILEISEYLCFHSQSHFGSMFKRYMEMTPRQYREKYKEKEFISEGI